MEILKHNQITEISNNQVIGKDIRTFLSVVSKESSNTYKTYENAINDFFLKTRKKNIDLIRVDDLNYSLKEIEKYQSDLLKTNKTSTVNTKMTAIKSLMDKLSQYDIPVNNKIFNIKKLKQYDVNSYDPMTMDEVKQVIELVKKTDLGEQKSLLVELAFVTAFRKSSLLNIKWHDIETRNGFYVIKALGKGKKWDTKKISDDLYVRLLEYKAKHNLENDDKVFSMSSKTVDRMMEFVRNNIDFGQRNITFHSFKKSSIEEVAILTNGDIKSMQRQGNHSNATTTLNSYLKNKDVNDLVLVDLNNNLNIDMLKDLTKEQILDIIMTCDRETQSKIMNVAKEKRS